MSNENGEVLVFTCAGASHVGQAANQAGLQLMRMQEGNLFCIVAVAAEVPEKMERTRKARALVAIDGCEDHCCKKILEKAGLPMAVHVVATDLAILKKPEKPHMAEDVQKIFLRAETAIHAIAD